MQEIAAVPTNIGSFYKNCNGQTSVHKTNLPCPLAAVAAPQRAHETRPTEYCPLANVYTGYQFPFSTWGDNEGGNINEQIPRFSTRHKRAEWVVLANNVASLTYWKRHSSSMAPVAWMLALALRQPLSAKDMWKVKLMGWDECNEKWSAIVGMLTHQNKLHVTFRFKFTFSVQLSV
jgi:hypothetical protein